MHGGNISCFFRIVGNCYQGNRKTLTHVYNIYRYSADRKNNYFFERKLPKNLVD